VDSAEETGSEPEFESGYGYSNLEVESNGVPTIWVDGEWRVSPSRFVRVGMPGARRRMVIGEVGAGLLCL
jgi:hypothetical protein